MQMDAMHEFATRRGWTVIDTVEEVASGATGHRPQRQALLTDATHTYDDHTHAGARAALVCHAFC